MVFRAYEECMARFEPDSEKGKKMNWRQMSVESRDENIVTEVANFMMFILKIDSHILPIDIHFVCNLNESVNHDKIVDHRTAVVLRLLNQTEVSSRADRLSACRAILYIAQVG